MNSKKEYKVLNIDKIKDYEEDILHNVVRGSLWTLLASSGILGLAIAASKGEEVNKLISYGLLTSSLYIPAVISFSNVSKLSNEMKKEMKKQL